MTAAEKRKAALMVQTLGNLQERADLEVVEAGSPEDLTRRLKAAYNGFMAAGRRAVGSFLEAGGILVELKRIRGEHGEWIPFLEENEIPPRWAQRAIWHYSTLQELPTKNDILSYLPATVADLTRILSAPRTQGGAAAPAGRSLEHKAKDALNDWMQSLTGADRVHAARALIHDLEQIIEKEKS